MALKFTLSLLALSGSAFADLPSITRKGQKFFYENGTEFFMKGVAYQQDAGGPMGEASASTKNESSSNIHDPLADEDACKRDVPLLKELGTNIIRTYAIDPTADHDACMKLLQEHGIYVVSDLGEPSLSINRDEPHWNVELFDRYKQVVDALAPYSNVVGFFAGNEVSNNATNTGASAYVKAAVRDTKKYISDQNYRWMGVGYAANDDKDIRRQIADYFNCGEDQAEAIDFWGYNIYSWCGESNFEDSGYNEQMDFFSNYSAPVFFAEYGCNKPDGAAGRIFEDTWALYQDNMTEVFSGGIVYMYFQTENDYGLVELDGGDVTKMDDFSALEDAIAKVDPSGVDMADYSSDAVPAECPAVNDAWQASDTLPPSPDSELCTCMSKSRTCVRADDLDPKDFQDIFNYICGEVPEACTAINGDASIGVYGSYSMCNPAEQLDYVLNAYYESQGSAETSCDFKGQAQIQSAASNDSCSDELTKASAHNSQVATATSALVDATGTSSGDGGDSAAPGMGLTRVMTLGDTAVGLYVVVSAIVGAGMVML